jgi:LysM repeat protein
MDMRKQHVGGSEQHREISTLLLLALVLLAVGCGRGSGLAASQPTIHIPTVTIPPTATVVPLASDRSTSTPMPTVTPTPIFYIVQKGDILGQIALDHGVSVEALMAANGLESAHLLSIGQRLIIPNESMLAAMAQGGLEVSQPGPTAIFPTPTLHPESISWNKAADYVGSQVQVEGAIRRTRKASGDVFLFFHYPPAGVLQIKIPSMHMEAFAGRPELDYLDHWLRIQGRIDRTDVGYQITITKPSQIEILDE